VCKRPPRLLTGERRVPSAAHEPHATTHGEKRGLAQGRGHVGQTARPRTATLVPTRARLAGMERRAHQRPAPSAHARPVPRPRPCRDGTLGRLGQWGSQSAGDRPSDGGPTNQASRTDGRDRWKLSTMASIDGFPGVLHHNLALAVPHAQRRRLLGRRVLLDSDSHHLPASTTADRHNCAWRYGILPRHGLLPQPSADGQPFRSPPLPPCP
jgi:hypothetical protein